MNKGIKLSVAVTATLLLTSFACANDETSKQSLKTNYQLIYNEKPKSVDNFTDMFKEGLFYGRLRSNTFYWGWEKESTTQYNHATSGLGGSLVYKSAKYADIDFTAGMYYSRGFFSVKSGDVSKFKPGAEVLSRFDYSNTGSQSMSVLGQAYLSYKGLAKTELSVGRQLVETFYTKSNDSKMIPNTFEGVVLKSKVIPDTAFDVAYLSADKLRAHTESHSILMYGDTASSSSTKPQWSENDDSAMHKGLTYTALKAAGKSTDAPLIVADIHNKSIPNLSFDAAYYAVPALISEVMGELNYKVKMGSFSLTPGVRYMKQFDNGAGAVGGAAYDGTTTGYKDPTSLDSQAVMGRLVGVYNNFKLNLGYSQIMDEADLITPWRGFPTGGYTRSMARYNWIANTKSYRAELSINGNKTGVYKDVFTQISFLHTDSDESKGQYDENYYYLGFVQNIPSLVDLQWRLRLGYTDTKKADADSLDARFELNYLF